MDGTPDRPQHRRNASSKSRLFKALVSPTKPRAEASGSSVDTNHQTKTVPLQPSHDTSQAKPAALNERQGNVQSPPSSPTKEKHKSKDERGTSRSVDKYMKKSKSSTNLGAVFQRLNRSSKDLSAAVQKDKENAAPKRISAMPLDTPIWAQFATTPNSDESRPDTGSSKSSDSDATGRKTSGGSAEQPPPSARLNILKRGGKVMAAVAAYQGTTKDQSPTEEKPLDPKQIDEAFEAVLDSRNIPEPMRQKMRSLTLRVKADFIKQDQSQRIDDFSPPGTAYAIEKDKGQGEDDPNTHLDRAVEDETKATKRSRTRSRTFTWTKNSKRSDESPQKKPRSQSRSRPISVIIPKSTEPAGKDVTTPTSGTFGSFGRKAAASAIPADYIAYLKKNQDPPKVEVGRLHKLRILLRNETVTWVDNFVSLDGMSEIVGLLHRIMAIEWREEHEDQLLNETLLCLKGLCTTERAMAELDRVAGTLFPALLAMLFDDEKKGPAEYSTRSIIINVLFNYLSSASRAPPAALERRARMMLIYLGEPAKAETDKPVDFVLDMHTPRPYRLWSREFSNVTREVFWIFLHHLNVVPLPKDPKHNSDTATQDTDRLHLSSYSQRHFPGIRPPVPAAPYIGGVEWDATTYLTAHLDLLNGLIAALPSVETRNQLRSELRASGFEKTMGGALRTCKEKFYGGVHDGLRSWVAAAAEDHWPVDYVREGPTMEEQASRAKSASPKKSPKKKDQPPKLDAPKLDLDLKVEEVKTGTDDGWLE